MEFICMFCGRKHIRTAPMVEERIDCECGQRFFAFYNQKLTVTIPYDEMSTHKIARYFMRFVVSTGRCRHWEVDAYEYAQFVKEANPLGLLKAGLERYQDVILGERVLSCGDVVTLCSMLADCQDALVKNKGRSIEISEIRKKVKKQAEYLNIMEKVTAQTG